MATTIEEVARHVAGLVNADNDLLLVGEWVARRWQEIANSTTLRALRKTGELAIPAPVNTGTVSATLNSTTVTGSGTTWTNDLVGRHFRINQDWHEIAQVVSSTQLTLVTPFADATVTGAAYNIIQRRLALAKDARKLGVFVHMRLRRPLHTVSQMGLNMMIPSRFEINSVPKWVSEMEPDIDGTKRVEIYPYPKDEELIHYLYWAEPPLLRFKDYIPGEIDTEALREGVLIDVYRNMMNKALQEGNVNVAGFYRNEMRTQETTWKNVHKKRIFQQDDGLDDLEFILMKQPAHPRRTEDRVIDTAYDQVWFT